MVGHTEQQSAHVQNFSMSHFAIALHCLGLSACAAPTAPEPDPEPMTTTASKKGPIPENPATADVPQASIAGAIRTGTRAAPAMRVCAMTVAGGEHHCVMTTAGASNYRIDIIPAGRYHLAGWVREGKLKLVAHADIVRCIKAPCPPDQLRVVEIADGQVLTGIDLSAPYSVLPDGWPSEPAQ